SSRRRHTRCLSDWSSDVCSSDLDPDQAKQALAELGAIASRTFPTMKPDPWTPKPFPAAKPPDLKTYTDPVATRKAYGEAIAALRSEERRVGKECRDRGAGEQNES